MIEQRTQIADFLPEARILADGESYFRPTPEFLCQVKVGGLDLAGIVEMEYLGPVSDSSDRYLSAVIIYFPINEGHDFEKKLGLGPLWTGNTSVLGGGEDFDQVFEKIGLDRGNLPEGMSASGGGTVETYRYNVKMELARKDLRLPQVPYVAYSEGDAGQEIINSDYQKRYDQLHSLHFQEMVKSFQEVLGCDIKPMKIKQLGQAK